MMGTSVESIYHRFERQLAILDRRRRLAETALWLPRAVAGGAVMACLAAAIARWRPVWTQAEVAWLAVGAVAVPLLVALLVIWLVPRSALARARAADRAYGLAERAVAAVEIHDGALPVDERWRRHQLDDAVAATGTALDARRPLPFERRDWAVLVAAIGLLVVALLLPNPVEAALLEQRAMQAAIDEQVAALEALQDEIRDDAALTPEQRAALAAPLADAAEELAASEGNQARGVAALSEAEAELRALRDEFDAAALQEQLAQAGAPLAGDGPGDALGSALQQADLAGAADAAFELADGVAGLSADEQAALADQLAATGEALRDVDEALAQQLTEAADALAQGDAAAAAAALAESGATLQSRAAAAAQAAAAAAAADTAAEQVAQGREELGGAGQATAADGADGDGAAAGNGTPGGDGEGQGVGPGQIGEDGAAGSGGTGRGGGAAENVFAPGANDLGDFEGVDVELPAECRANPAECGQLRRESPTEFDTEESVVPYEEVFREYRDAAYEALEDPYVPLGLKDIVRDYFSSLEP